MFNNIVIYGKYNGIQSWELIDKAIHFLQSRHKTVFLDAFSCADFPIDRYGVKLVHRDEDLDNMDLAIVVGGDGTLLDVARSIVTKHIPVIGINLGRLGFLTDISPSVMIQSLSDIINGEYDHEKRNLLEVTIIKNNKVLFNQVAFNDVVLHKNDSPRMVEFETFIDNRFLSSQRSDGLIVATPTGSTAYALSAGGPILDPTMDVFSLVSINPHTMSNRPLVISGQSEVMIRPHENCEGNASIICDGQVTFHITADHKTFIKRHANLLTMIHPKGHDHLQLLRAKLNWGQKL
ncbi:NAD(+) kinase [Thiosulfativibrio zosterae]|uniref:NAD kinase n=1 Tax=Thiosulfativibrio zosterae TaxID=2675053 RepID=A0A6F8PPA4_9GAMM|nr:NAD(+) kinase [Thiosulfativibrio zosterae]BBP43868.1 NAD kinase [Thiosulfativibrio zosterae]